MITPTASAMRWPVLVPLLAVLAFSACGEGGGGGQSLAVRMESNATSGQCVVTIGYAAQGVADIADMALDYSEVEGSFGANGRDARCRSLIDGATRVDTLNRCSDAACEQGGHRDLYLVFAMGESYDDLTLETPADLFECLFEGDGETLSNLTGRIEVTGPGFTTHDTGAVEVRVNCDGWPNTTTTTSTTTTSLLPCGGESCEAGEVIPIQIWLDDAVTLGALQLNIDFSSLVGGFDQHATTAAKCTLHPGVNALFATNQTPRIDDPDCDACQRRLVVAMVFGAGYTGPGPLMNCRFVVGQQPPTAADISLQIVEATTVWIDPIDPLPGISLRGFPED